MRHSIMVRHWWWSLGAVAVVLTVVAFGHTQAQAQQQKPNIILILSDDFGYGDSGPYGGGPGRGMPTPSLERLADEDDLLHVLCPAELHAGPCGGADGAHPQPQRHDRGLPGPGRRAASGGWTLASVLKQAGYQTFFTGKWHLGEADYAMPTAQGYDEMQYVGLYHLNAYTYADPTWFPDMDPKLRAMFAQVTKGALSGKAGEQAKEDFKINGQYVNTPAQGSWGFRSLTNTSRKRRSSTSIGRPGLARRSS